MARLQELCKSLGTPIIASAAFAEVCGSELVSLGEQEPRGVDETVEVFTLPGLQMAVDR